MDDAPKTPEEACPTCGQFSNRAVDMHLAALRAALAEAVEALRPFSSMVDVDSRRARAVIEKHRHETT